jgi:hypothetical protein
MYKAREQIDAVLKHLYKSKDVEKSLPTDDVLSDKELLLVCGNKSEIDRMIRKLLDDNYAMIYYGYPIGADGKEDESNSQLTYVGITFNGRLFFENGGYKKDLIRKRILEFPKTYWWVIAIFGFTIGFFADVIKERLKQKKQPLPSQSQQDTQSVGYNLQTHKSLPYYLDTFYIGVDTVYKQ